MDNKRETNAKKSQSQFGKCKYKCPYCRPSSSFSFLQLIDHLVIHEFMKNHKVPEKPFGMDGELWRHLEAQRRNPGKPSYLVCPLPPYVVDSLAWAEPSQGLKRKILPEQKMFLPAIAHWLEQA